MFDLTGRRFGRLTVLERSPENHESPCGTKTLLWICLCDPELGGCGCKCVVLSKSLLGGRTRSCGCLRSESSRSRAAANRRKNERDLYSKRGHGAGNCSVHADNRRTAGPASEANGRDHREALLRDCSREPSREGGEAVKRYCKRFYCDHLGDRICCASCRYRRDCSNPCLNHPSRCGLEDVKRKEDDANDSRKEG